LKTINLKLPLGLILMGCCVGYCSTNADAVETSVSSITNTTTTSNYSSVISSISSTTEVETLNSKEVTLNENIKIDIDLKKLAFNQNSSSIYIYEKPNENSKKVGILPANGIGEVTDYREFSSDIEKFIAGDAEWYKIQSGDISGYIKNEDLLVGTKAVERLNEAYGSMAKITSNTNVRVRVSASTNADVIDNLKPDTIVQLNKNSKNNKADWTAVLIDGEEGYIRSDLVTPINDDIVYATKYSAPQKETTNKNQIVIPPEEETPSEVVKYAMQFLGNPYVWGGTSLTNGADCSGFVMSVYSAFGVSLPHSSLLDRNVGVAVAYDEIQPGDIVCYDGHVGIYAGDGKIVNALNKRSGIVLTNVNYDTVLAVRRVL
jgi:cell wall-associated NlpC family hydrolase